VHVGLTLFLAFSLRSLHVHIELVLHTFVTKVIRRSFLYYAMVRWGTHDGYYLRVFEYMHVPDGHWLGTVHDTI
jgi:hypothetical protein